MDRARSVRAATDSAGPDRDGIETGSRPNPGVALDRSFYRGRMLPVLVACTTAASCAGMEIGPPLWMLLTAMIGIFLLLIGAAVAVGAVYRRNH